MSLTLTIRLTEELARWLSLTASRTHLPRGRIVRDQLEKARAEDHQGFMLLAGVADKAENLSSRRGFSPK